jgi:CCR4-NOT transcription complex subunit 4
MYSQRRLAQQKKQRERERKDLDALGRRNLANVRVVQRNVVYVVGIGPRFAKEEVLCHLLSLISISISPLFPS